MHTGTLYVLFPLNVHLFIDPLHHIFHSQMCQTFGKHLSNTDPERLGIYWLLSEFIKRTYLPKTNFSDRFKCSDIIFGGQSDNGQANLCNFYKSLLVL